MSYFLKRKLSEKEQEFTDTVAILLTSEGQNIIHFKAKSIKELYYYRQMTYAVGERLEETPTIKVDRFEMTLKITKRKEKQFGFTVKKND